MKGPLKSLTPEQETQLAPWADQWIKKGLCTDEADWASFEEGARRCYEFAGIEWPNRIVRVGNPLALALAAPIAGSLWVRDAVHGAVYGAVHDAVGGAVGDAVGGAVGGAVGDAVGGAVYGAVHDAVRDAVGGAVGDAVRDAVRDAVGGSWWRYLGGCWWLSWQAYESFFRVVVGLDLGCTDRAEAYALAQSSAGWWWPHQNFVMVCDRPSEIHRERVRPRGWGSHRLHREDGPAISYRDGWALYFWHGVHVDERVIMRPESITLDEIEAQENVEVRRVLIERYGAAKYLSDTGAKVVSADFEGARKGAAPRCLIEDSRGDRLLIGTDGSTSRVYVMPVDRECETPQQAHESICGFSESRILNKS